MLCTTDNTVTKIAMLCGFGSSNYFKDVFKPTSGFPRGNTEKTPACAFTRTCGPTDRSILYDYSYCKESPYLSKMRLKINELQ